jgi:acetyl-CoA synthetase
MQVGRVSRAVQAHGRTRGLSTARAALRVAWMLATRPEGVRADEVAEVLGKSVSTAYNVLASLCEEGVAVRHPGGLYRLAPAFRQQVAEAASPPPPPAPRAYSRVADELYARTHKRAYVGVVHEGVLRVVVERGQRGMPRLDMDPEIRDSAHALALGKVALALAGPDAVDRYLRAGLASFTPQTVTDPDRLRGELEAIRRTGVGADEEEFAPDFCCLAAPILDARGHFLAVAGIALTRRAFAEERAGLEAALLDVAHRAGHEGMTAEPFQPCADPREVLDSEAGRDLASTIQSAIR